MTRLTIDREELEVARDEVSLGLTKMDDAEAQRRAEQNDALGKEFLTTWPHAADGPTLDQYDYGALTDAGFTLTDIPDDPVLPNEFVKPDAMNLGGVDVATGARRFSLDSLSGAPMDEPVSDDLVDPEDGEEFEWRELGQDLSDISLASLRSWLRASMGFFKGAAQFVADQTDPEARAFGGEVGQALRSLVDMAAPGASDKFFERITELPEPEFLEETSGAVEDMAGLLLQFGYGYVFARGKGGPPTAKLMQTMDEIRRGAVGIQSFDPAEGTLGTALEDMGLLPDFLSFLDSRGMAEDHGRFAGRLAMAVEEGVVTATVASGLAMLAATAKRMHNANMGVLIYEGAQQFREGGTHLHSGLPTEEGQEPTGYAGKATQRAREGLELVARGLRGYGWSEDGWVEHAMGLGIDENVARATWRKGLNE